MTKIVRRLTIDDYDDMLHVWATSGLPFKPHGRESRDNIEREIAHPTCAFFGTFIDDKMIGVVIAQFDGRRGWINRLAIDPDFRGQRLAGELIAECEKYLDQFGEMVISALIEEENGPSMSCFEKSGYSCLPSIKYWSKRPREDL